MTFERDPYWVDALEFVRTVVSSGDVVVAPQWICGAIGQHGYETADVRRSYRRDADVVVLHKGELADVDSRYLSMADSRLRAVHANDVFVVFVRRDDVAALGADDAGYLSFRQQRAAVWDQISAGGEAGAKRASPGTGAVYVGDHTALLRLDTGEKLYVDTSDVSVTPHLLLDGTWEPWMTKVISDRLGPGMTFVDIGANLGYFTVLAASAVGPEGQVHAFEADAALADLVARSASINGMAQVSVIAAAVFDRTGTIEFHTSERRRATGSIIYDPDADDRSDGEVATTVEVPVVTLDDHYGETIPRIDVMKIDAEGAEPAIFRGMRRVLAANPQICVFFECSPAIYALGGEDAHEMLSSLEDQGFDIATVHRDGTIGPFAAAEMSVNDHLDLMITRREGVD